MIHILRALDLLRGHVGGRAERAAAEGEREAATGLAIELGHAEVGDLHAPGGINEDVLRLDVAVEDALAVRVFQGRADGGDDVQRLARSHRGGVHGLTEIHAVHVFHEQPVVVAAHAEVEDADDVGMAELCQRSAFAGEALGKRRVRSQLPREDFQCGHSIQMRLAHFIHAPHAARADELEDLELREGPHHIRIRRRGRRIAEHHGGLHGLLHEAARAHALRGTGGDGRAAAGTVGFGG